MVFDMAMGSWVKPRWNPEAGRRFPGNLRMQAWHGFAIRQPIETMREPVVR